MLLAQKSVSSELNLLNPIFRVPGVTIATDVICGFPTETWEDFQETVALVDQYKFPSLFINQFYPRPGTPAARMKRLPTEEVQCNDFCSQQWPGIFFHANLVLNFKMYRLRREQEKYPKSSTATIRMITRLACLKRWPFCCLFFLFLFVCFVILFMFVCLFFFGLFYVV